MRISRFAIKLLQGILFWAVVVLGFLFFANKAFAAESPYREIIMTMTEEEIVEIQQVLCLEAGIDTWEGRVATAQVIFNRVLSPRFKENTVHEVLSAKGQYSTYKRRHKANYDERESDAIEFLCDGEMEDFPIGLDRVYQDNKPIGKNPIKVGKQFFGK